MTEVKLIVKGAKADFEIKGSTFAEVQREYLDNRSQIHDLIGEPLVSTTAPPSKELISTSVQGRITSLLDTGFFQSPKKATEVMTKLKETGYTYDIQRVSIGLMRLVRKRSLRRLTEERNGKEVYVYVVP